MVFVLPEDQSWKRADTRTAGGGQRLARKPARLTTPRVMLPKFTTAVSTQLENLLAEMGMPLAFGRRRFFPDDDAGRCTSTKCVTRRSSMSPSREQEATAATRGDGRSVFRCRNSRPHAQRREADRATPGRRLCPLQKRTRRRRRDRTKARGSNISRARRTGPAARRRPNRPDDQGTPLFREGPGVDGSWRIASRRPLGD